MCNPVAAVMAVSALVSGGQAYSANRNAKKMARQQREDQENLAQQQARTRNQGSGSIFEVDTENAGSDIGLGNTFLTGSQGVSNDSLNLGGGINNKLGG